MVTQGCATVQGTSLISHNKCPEERKQTGGHLFMFHRLFGIWEARVVGKPAAAELFSGFSVLWFIHPQGPPMLAVRIAGLSPGLHSYDFQPEAEEVGLDPEAFRDLDVHVRLDYDPDRIFVRLNASATATLLCDRTLVSFDEDIEGDYALLFTADADGDADAVEPLPSDAVSIDLADAVRDTLVLALPSRRVAPGAEDAPIQTQFGTLTDDEGNPIDPRWEALRRFKDHS